MIKINSSFDCHTHFLDDNRLELGLSSSGEGSLAQSHLRLTSRRCNYLRGTQLNLSVKAASYKLIGPCRDSHDSLIDSADRRLFEHICLKLEAVDKIINKHHNNHTKHSHEKITTQFVLIFIINLIFSLVQIRCSTSTILSVVTWYLDSASVPYVTFVPHPLKVRLLHFCRGKLTICIIVVRRS